MRFIIDSMPRLPRTAPRFEGSPGIPMKGTHCLPHPPTRGPPICKTCHPSGIHVLLGIYIFYSNWSIKNAREESKEHPNLQEVFWGPLEVRISCHFLPFDQTEDICLKSALEGKSGVSLIKGRSKRNIPLPIFKNEPMGRNNVYTILQRQDDLKVDDYRRKLSCRPVGTKENENISIIFWSKRVFSGEINKKDRAIWHYLTVQKLCKVIPII